MTSHQAKAEMLIHSTASQAFDAFVDPATLSSFWLAKSSAPLAPGARVQWDFMVPGARENVVVTAFERPGHLAFDWSGGIAVDLRFSARDAASVVVTVVASGFSRADDAIGATEGFAIVLCDLKTLLESGRSAKLVRDKAALIAGSGTKPQ